MLLERVLLHLVGPCIQSRPPRCPGDHRHHRPQFLIFFGYSPQMVAQLRRRLPILGNIVHAGEILRLTCVALWSDAITLYGR